MRTYLLAGIIVAAMTNQALAETVYLYAAGSLRAALTELSGVFEAASGDKVQPKWGASGLLKEEIANGAKAEVFASANMEHPQALEKSGKSGPVVMFARNRLCALAKQGLDISPASLLDRMLDPSIKLGTSTPKADPSGDYAWDVFRKAEVLKPGALTILDKKALQLTGGPSSPPPPGRSIYGVLVAEGKADVFLMYCTNALVAKRENPGQQIVALPNALTVGADYGLTVMRGASPNANGLVKFILSADGQKILATHGFSAPN